MSAFMDGLLDKIISSPYLVSCYTDLSFQNFTVSGGKAGTSHLCDGSAHSSGCVVNGSNAVSSQWCPCTDAPL